MQRPYVDSKSHVDDADYYRPVASHPGGGGGGLNLDGWNTIQARIQDFLGPWTPPPWTLSA